MSQRLCVSEALRGCHAVGLGLMEAISDSTHCFDPPGAGASELVKVGGASGS